jgi:hypothetical protein
MSLTPAALGFRAHMGWAAAVGVALDGGAPRLVHSSIIATAEAGDRLSNEPYHVAGGWDGSTRAPPHPDPKAAIAEGRKTQVRLATKAITAIAGDLKQQKLKLVCGVVLATRSWLGHSLESILGDHAHVRVYESEAVRDAVRAGLKANKIACHDVDQKSLVADGSETLKLSEERLKKKLTDLRGDLPAPWREDQKLAALAAWLSLTS